MQGLTSATSSLLALHAVYDLHGSRPPDGLPQGPPQRRASQRATDDSPPLGQSCPRVDTGRAVLPARQGPGADRPRHAPAPSSVPDAQRLSRLAACSLHSWSELFSCPMLQRSNASLSRLRLDGSGQRRPAAHQVLSLLPCNYLHGWGSFPANSADVACKSLCGTF